MAQTLIQTITVGAGGASSIDFNGVPNTFTDLYIVTSLRTSDGYPDTGVLVQLNGSTSSYSRRTLYGTGSAAVSSTGSDIAFFSPAATATANTFGNTSIYIPNYAGATNKSVSVDTVNENNAGYSLMAITAGLWSNTAAVTSVRLTSATSSTLLQGSTASLYGVKKDNILPAPKATGGDISYAGGYWYHAFKASGTFTPTVSLTADVLLVAGGGGGRSNNGGGGGAGGLLYTAGTSLTATGYPVVVGGGGGRDSSGSDSTFNTSTAIGGGRGGQNSVGASGGSGGGGNYAAGGAGTAGQGNAGGAGQSNNVSGGGGGAGSAGGAANSSQGGAGGTGSSAYSTWASATSTGVGGYYAGGGGGPSQGGSSGGAGGAGGGGQGNSENYAPSVGTGVTNTGGGGGGGFYSAAQGFAGGSGIVIVRYLA